MKKGVFFGFLEAQAPIELFRKWSKNPKKSTLGSVKLNQALLRGKWGVLGGLEKGVFDPFWTENPELHRGLILEFSLSSVGDTDMPSGLWGSLIRKRSLLADPAGGSGGCQYKSKLTIS